MPDLPTPQDATEAALFSECWDAVLSYADLCTSGSAAANRLATEAFRHGVAQARAAGDGAGEGVGDGPGAGHGHRAKSGRRRAPGLPRIPLLLTSVRTTAAAWEAQGQGHRLDPDLRLWLNSAQAARYSGPPPGRPLALRGLKDLQEADADLLWLAEAEALPLPAVARRLGLDPDSAAGELAQVRALFRDRCRRDHLDTPMDAHCRSYARLLDAVTRSPGTDVPEDLSRHLAGCVTCAEAAACLRLHGGGLPAALAGGVIGWGGLAYLERRRRAADAGLTGGRADVAEDTGLTVGAAARPRIGRTGILTAALGVSALALAVSLMPFDGGTSGDSVSGRSQARQPVTDPAPSLSAAGTLPPDPTTSPRPSATATAIEETGNGPGTQDASSSPARVTRPPADPTASADPPAKCRAAYRLDTEWPDGFQATVTVTTAEALDTWQLSWTFADGQRVTQMWDATYIQHGSRVTATAADYNKSVAAGGSFSFGFLGSWDDGNAAPADMMLNGRHCGMT
ncbi:cellulose binding domain-containing protein [Streptomyces sp. NPDC059786]|uniref:cellulose binding domain-containing protein n=1 Tax=Streptomyces sp. NPDC059786 TaxID=3346946 RepID=UPI00365135B3